MGTTAGADVVSEPAPVEELLDGFLTYLADVRRLSAHTVRAYQTDLESYLGWCEQNGTNPLSITQRRLRAYLANMTRARYADKTINRRLSSLRTFYGWLVREEVLELNPAASIPGRKLPKTLPKTMVDEDVRRILEACEEGTAEGLRDRAFIELLYASGARISEVAGLKPEDIDFSQGQVRLFGKGSKERIVPLYAVALAAIGAYLQEGRPELVRRRKGMGSARALFVSARGNDMTAGALRTRFERLVKLAGVDGTVTPHAMRHTFATELLTGGADLKAVQELLGHESLATTQIYTHLSVERLKAATRQAHPRG